MNLLDFSLTAMIIIFLILIVWSRVQQQKMYDTVMEIREIVSGLVSPLAEEVKR